MESPQLPLICDTLETAIAAVVVALGGNKRAGATLWPAMPADEAGRRLAQSLNPDRREKLSPGELLMLMREGRKVGAHTIAAYLLHECGYAEPQPIEPEDERAALQRQYIEAVHTLANLQTRIDRVGLRAA